MTVAPGPEARETGQDFLGHCLLEGNSELKKRTRRGKRRAILISVILQILFVAALVLLPFLGKSENIAARVLVYPRVPYAPARAPHVRDRQPATAHSLSHFFPARIPPVIRERDLTPPAPPQISQDTGDSEIARNTVGGSGLGVPFAESTPAPKPPEPPRTSPQPHSVRVSGLVVCWACSVTWRCESSARPDRGKG